MLVEHAFEGLSHRFVSGTGPIPCPVLLVGESPGHEEDSEGFCFVGKTGRELDRFYLPLAELERPQVRICNLLPVHPFINRNPTKEEIEFFEHFLLEEIIRVEPKFIVPMGAFAAKYFLGSHRDLHQIHGLPFTSKRFPGVTILPSYHPAAGLHNNDTQPLIVHDFEQVRLAMQGLLAPRAIDNFKDPIYIELKNAQEVYYSLASCGALLMGADTEGYKGNPWGLSYSIGEGVAYVIRSAAKEAIAEFAKWIKAHPECKIILHNSLHDLPILREMGVDVSNFEDTMVYSYSLCIEPQGLKDLSYRHCGMKMKSYEDITGPAMRKLTAEYLIKVAAGDWGLDPEVPEMESAQVIKYRQPQALHKRALRAVNDIYGFWTGTIMGPKRGGSARLDELGVRVGKVDKETVARESLPKEWNAWFAEVPLPVKPKLDEIYGDYIFELKPPVAPEDPPDATKRWASMSSDLEESTARCEEALGALPEVGLDAVEDQQTAINYSARDADSTLRMRHKIRAKVEANGLTKLAELDMSVLPYLDRMRTAGIMVNRKHMLDYGEQLKGEMRALQEKLHADLGVWINPSSSQQVAMVIYDMLGFPIEVRTKEGQPSTNDKILEALAPLHKNITDITDYRELHKLRSTYCVAPETRILDENLRWVRADSLFRGSKLLAFEENPTALHGQWRKFKKSEVESIETVNKPCFQLLLEDGSEIVCSEDHMWLCRKSPNTRLEWVRTDKLFASDGPLVPWKKSGNKLRKHDFEIVKALDTWSDRTDFDSGYLSGITDGEGWISNHTNASGACIGIAQKVGPVLDRIIELVKRNGFKYQVNPYNEQPDMRRVNIQHRKDIIRFLGEFQPRRLLSKFMQRETFPSLPCARTVRVIKRTPLGVQPVIAMQTSTRTFLAEGFASHNCLKLPRWTDAYDRVHPNWKYTRVASGRLATSDPNLLGIPVRSERGNVIRQGFIPGPGRVFIGADLSQIEVRVAAHYSQDPNLCKIFRTAGADFHTLTTMYMWGITEAEVDADKKLMGGASKRASAKNVSFGVLYGISAKGLQAQLKSKCHTDWSEEQCQNMIDLWLNEAYPQVKWYMEKQKHLCKQKGYVESLNGRRRYLPGVHSTIPRIREEAYRAAINHPIQSTAAEVLKIAERDIWNELLPYYWKRGKFVEPILAVHDELIFEVDLDVAEEVLEGVIFRMENAVQLCVPVVSEGHSSRLACDGGSWADLK